MMIAKRSLCPKCGSKDIHTSYHAPGCSKESCNCNQCNYNDHSKEHDEHLHRYCRGCRYDWIDPVLDTSPSEGGSNEI